MDGAYLILDAKSYFEERKKRLMLGHEKQICEVPTDLMVRTAFKSRVPSLRAYFHHPWMVDFSSLCGIHQSCSVKGCSLLLFEIEWEELGVQSSFSDSIYSAQWKHKRVTTLCVGLYMAFALKHTAHILRPHWYYMPSLFMRIYDLNIICATGFAKD